MAWSERHCFPLLEWKSSHFDGNKTYIQYIIYFKQYNIAKGLQERHFIDWLKIILIWCPVKPDKYCYQPSCSGEIIMFGCAVDRFWKMLIGLVFLQQLRQRRMAFLSSNFLAGAWRAKPSRKWWLSTRPLALSSMSCPSAPSLFPWRSLTIQNTAPSSTTPPCCLVTGGPLLSTGKW